MITFLTFLDLSISASSFEFLVEIQRRVRVHDPAYVDDVQAINITPCISFIDRHQSFFPPRFIFKRGTMKGKFGSFVEEEWTCFSLFVNYPFENSVIQNSRRVQREIEEKEK